MGTKLKITLLISFILFETFQFNSAAQTLYEVKFSDEEGNGYLGFLVYYNETDSYMRMAYNSKERYRVVNIKYAATTGVQDGSNYFVLTGYEPSFIEGGGDGEVYNPDSFVWLWNDGQESGLPYTSDDPEFKPESFRLVESYVELDASQLTEEYLHQFYSTSEPDYKAFLSMINDGFDNTIDNSYEDAQEDYTYSNTANNENYTNVDTSSTSTTTVENTSGDVTMHFIVVANTEIGDIGVSCDVDKRNLISEFEGVSEALKIKFKPYVVDGKDFTRENVLTTINNVHVGANDVVMFVYTGHGYRWSDQTEKYPRMDLRYNSYQKISNETSLNLSEVYSMINAKGARLTITFGDCCNADVGVNARTSTSFLSNRSNPNYKQEKLEKLFLKSKGNLIATAASPGQVSWSNSVNGGFFISSFIQAFHEEISYLGTDVADWDGLIKNTVDQAVSKTTAPACGVCSVQNGVTTVKVSYK